MIAFSLAREAPAEAEVLAVPVFQGRVLPEGAGADVDSAFLEARGFEGKVGETQPLLADDGGTVVAVGVGPRDAVTPAVIRRAAAAAVRASWRNGHVATTLLSAVPSDLQVAAAAALAEGAALASYRFTKYKRDAKPCRVDRVTAVGRGARLERALERGATVAQAVCLARDLVNEPPGAMTPRKMVQVAEGIAQESGLSLEVLDEQQILEEGLGGLAGVAAGSDEPPRLIRFTYEPSGRSRGRIAIVGKGITFDSGGLSLKTGEGMMSMKSDMAGAAAVLGVMSAISALAPPVSVIGIACCTENMPSGKATKPGDVLRIRNGKTVEVLNTDAEGRLVLADGLSLAVEAGVDAIVDLATLTGAVSVALGREIAGLMANDDGLAAQVEAAATEAGEEVWRLPLPDRYRRHLDSDVADMKNIGRPSQAGTIVAGIFLKEFVAETPWVHLDIAGTAMSEEDNGHLAKGATGFGVRTLLELLTNFKRPAAASRR